jgi:hypothetical protein
VRICLPSHQTGRAGNSSNSSNLFSTALFICGDKGSVEFAIYQVTPTQAAIKIIIIVRFIYNISTYQYIRYKKGANSLRLFINGNFTQLSD